MIIKLMYLWFAYLVIGTVLLIGKAISHRLLAIHKDHYQIGISPSFFTFSFFKVKFSIGIIIPLPFLFKTYEIQDDNKYPIKSVWRRRELSTFKRMTAILGGIFFLYIISLVAYAVYFQSSIDTYLSMNEVNKNGIYVDSVGIQLGLESGDKILGVNGASLDKFSDLKFKLFSNQIDSLDVSRNDSLLTVKLDKSFSLSIAIANGNQIISPISPAKIDSVLMDGGAFHAGILSDDKIIAVNGDTVYYQQDFIQAMAQNIDDSIMLGVQRNTKNEWLNVIVKPDENGKIGVILENPLSYTSEKKTLINSINSGNLFIWNYIKQFKPFVKKEPEILAYRSVEGIARIYSPQKQHWRIIASWMLIYVCWSFFPTPITEGRFLLALFVDKFYKLPKSAPAWMAWIICSTLIITSVTISIIHFL